MNNKASSRWSPTEARRWITGDLSRPKCSHQPCVVELRDCFLKVHLRFRRASGMIPVCLCLVWSQANRNSLFSLILFYIKYLYHLLILIGYNLYKLGVFILSSKLFLFLFAFVTLLIQKLLQEVQDHQSLAQLVLLQNELLSGM